LAPAICYYEAARELERRNAKRQIIRLNEYCHEVPDRFISIRDDHLDLAAKLWAQARKSGKPTSGAESLDVDCILAAQAILLGLPESDFVIATTNVDHLTQFVPAALWTEISP